MLNRAVVFALALALAAVSPRPAEREASASRAAAIAPATPAPRAARQGSAPIVRQGFDVVVPIVPAPVPMGDGLRLAYEVHLTNFADVPLQLTSLQVEDASGATLVRVDRAALPAILQVLGDAAPGVTSVGPGRRAVAYLDLSVTRAPAAVSHRIAYATPDGSSHEVVVPAVAVDARAPWAIGPPLRGGPWVAVYAPEMARGHRRVLYATGGQVRLPGRFAVDWFRVDEAGATTRGSGDTPAGWLGHGAEVLAVADGVVAAVRDDVAEPAQFRGAPPVAIGDATGNFVALDAGDGRYVFYEHLARGVAVRGGERVRRGQVLGRVGASGQATGAHLHLHVADAASPLDAEGLPFVIDGAEVLGAYPTIDAVFRGERWNDGGGGGTRAAFPRPNAVLRFR